MTLCSPGRVIDLAVIGNFIDAVIAFLIKPWPRESAFNTLHLAPILTAIADSGLR